MPMIIMRNTADLRKNNGRHVNITAGQKLRIVVPSYANMGYLWSVKTEPEGIVEPGETVNHPSGAFQPTVGGAEPVMGGVGTQEIILNATGTGDVSLVLELNRPFDPNGPQHRVQMQVSARPHTPAAKPVIR